MVLEECRKLMEIVDKDKKPEKSLWGAKPQQRNLDQTPNRDDCIGSVRKRTNAVVKQFITVRQQSRVDNPQEKTNNEDLQYTIKPLGLTHNFERQLRDSSEDTGSGEDKVIPILKHKRSYTHPNVEVIEQETKVEIYLNDTTYKLISLLPSHTKYDLLTISLKAFNLEDSNHLYTVSLWKDHKLNSELRDKPPYELWKKLVAHDPQMKFHLHRRKPPTLHKNEKQLGPNMENWSPPTQINPPPKFDRPNIIQNKRQSMTLLDLSKQKIIHNDGTLTTRSPPNKIKNKINQEHSKTMKRQKSTNYGLPKLWSRKDLFERQKSTDKLTKSKLSDMNSNNY